MDARFDPARNPKNDASDPRRAQRRVTRISCLPDRPNARWDARSGLKPSGRAIAEEGVRLVYRAAGLSLPRIVWCSSPKELAHAWAAAACGDGIDADAGNNVVELPCRQGLQRRQGAGCDKAGLERTLFGGERARVISEAVQTAVIEAVGTIRPPFLSSMKHAYRRGRWGARPVFAAVGYGPSDLCSANIVAGVGQASTTEADPALHGLRLIAANAGWLVPYETVCWLSLCPDVLSCDRSGRLHCGHGPALRYPDGWGLYAWKGTPLPARIITQPETITLQRIDAQIDPCVRHAMIDILTPSRFIEAGGAEHVASDSTGTLWKRRWTHRGVMIDAWAAVETGGARRIIQCVPASIITPREALGWLGGPDSS